MKYISRIAKHFMYAVLLGGSLTACQELDIDTQPSGKKIVETDALETYTCISTMPDPIVFNIAATTAWKIEQSDSTQWCRVSPKMSAISGLNSEIKVYIDDNKEYIDRVATLTIVGEGVAEKHTITITQSMKTNFVYQPIKDLIPAEGGEYTFTIQSNKDWTVRSEKSWLMLDKQNGVGSDKTETITASITANTEAKRDAKVYLSNGEQEVYFIVTQSGLTLEFDGVSGNQDTYLAAGETKTYRVNANIDWVASCENPYAVLSKIGENELKVTLPANNIFSSKRTEIVLQPASEELTGAVENRLTINQTSTFDYSGAASNMSINADGAVTLSNANSEESRMITKEVYGLGTYIWKFEDVNIASDCYFDLNAWPLENDANYHFYFGEIEGNELLSGGGVVDEQSGDRVSFWADKSKFDLSYEKLNAMKELKLVVKANETDVTKLVFEVYINGELITEITNRVNIWHYSPSHGMQLYFGFVAGYGSTSSMTIKSFDILPEIQ